MNRTSVKLRLLAVLLLILCVLPSFAACTPSGNSPSESTDSGTGEESTENGESTGEPENTTPGAVSEDGTVRLELLGVHHYDSFGGVRASDGNTIVVVYFEACNQSTEEQYVYRNALSLNARPLDLNPEEVPAPYEYFGGFIASGMKKQFCLAFEMEVNWYKILIEYRPFSGRLSEFLLSGKEYPTDAENAELLPGDASYPFDKRDDSVMQTDFEILRERYLTAIWGSPDANAAAVYESRLEKTDDGSKFTNVDYTSTSRSAWDVVNHMIQLRFLVSCYGEERLKTDEQARATAMSVLNYWLKNDFTADNWWYNEIQTPRYLAWTALMLKPYLTEEQTEKIDRIIGKGTLRGSSKATTYTGANLTDMMATTILHALFVDDPDLLMSAVGRVSAELVIAKPGQEGIQSDGSYFQHGTLLCAAGSYGAVLMQGMRTFISQLYGTVYSIPESRLELLIDHLLDGQRYFHRAYGTAYFSIGRSAVYANGAGELAQTAALLATLDGIHRQDELKAYAESFGDFSKCDDLFKYFELSYSLVRSCPQYYMAVRGAHKGFILTEVVNTQNVLGYNLSYGSNTCYMYYGDEYQAIGAVLDFAMFPGITTYHEGDEALYNRYKNGGYAKTWGKNTYTGTHCDGKTDEATEMGALYMELINDGLRGKLSFISYKGMMICLGAGMSGSKGGLEIRTSLDQCKLNQASIGGVPMTLNGEDVTVSGGTAVKNGAFAYYNLGEGNLTASAKSMTGSYSRTDSAALPVEMSADVFQLWISYGTSMSNASYAYAVVANGDGAAPADAASLPIQKITNTSSIQAVEFTDGHAVIVFHEAGTYTLANGQTVTSTGPDIVIV